MGGGAGLGCLNGLYLALYGKLRRRILRTRGMLFFDADGRLACAVVSGLFGLHCVL